MTNAIFWLHRLHGCAHKLMAARIRLHRKIQCKHSLSAYRLCTVYATRCTIFHRWFLSVIIKTKWHESQHFPISWKISTMFATQSMFANDTNIKRVEFDFIAFQFSMWTEWLQRYRVADTTLSSVSPVLLRKSSCAAEEEGSTMLSHLKPPSVTSQCSQKCGSTCVQWRNCWFLVEVSRPKRPGRRDAIDHHFFGHLQWDMCSSWWHSFAYARDSNQYDEKCGNCVRNSRPTLTISHRISFGAFYDRRQTHKMWMNEKRIICISAIARWCAESASWTNIFSQVKFEMSTKCHKMLLDAMFSAQQTIR